MTQNIPVENQPFLYINGLQVSNNATTPDELVNLAAGSARDSSDTMDIILESAVVINSAANGAINRLDTGTIAANSVYAIYVIGDSSSKKQPAGLMSLASNAAPVLPFGYDSYRKVGYVVTDATADILLHIQSGNNNYRLFTFDVPIATAVIAGNSATYADVALASFVPAELNIPVLIECDWTANAAGDTLALHARNATGDTVKYIAGVAGASAHTLVRDYVQAQLDSGLPEIQYKVSAGTVAINVAGFQFFI